MNTEQFSTWMEENLEEFVKLNPNVHPNKFKAVTESESVVLHITLPKVLTCLLLHKDMNSTLAKGFLEECLITHFMDNKELFTIGCAVFLENMQEKK